MLSFWKILLLELCPLDCLYKFLAKIFVIWEFLLELRVLLYVTRLDALCKDKSFDVE